MSSTIFTMIPTLGLSNYDVLVHYTLIHLHFIYTFNCPYSYNERLPSEQKLGYAVQYNFRTKSISGPGQFSHYFKYTCIVGLELGQEKA